MIIKGRETPDRMPKGIIFDMDNTLYNFFDAKLLACERVTEMIGAGDGNELFRYFLAGHHGFEDPQNIRDYMINKEVWDEKLFIEASEVYEEVKTASIYPYPGVMVLVPEIRDSGIGLSIVTDAEGPQAEKRLKKLGLFDFFECIVTPDITGKRKPDPENFHKAMDAMGTIPEETMVVGDSLKREIEPGNKLGLTTVHAKYGDWLKTPFPSIKPHHTLERFDELRDILKL